jgi:hypothetical protein
VENYSTDIEKKNLEAHVELCAERYRSLDERLDIVNVKVEKVEHCVENIRDMMAVHVEKHNDRIIAWGLGVISFMTAVIGYLVATFVFQ